MTETEKHSFSSEAVGASRMTPFVNAAAPEPFDADQVLVFNPNAGRVLTLARNQTTGAFQTVRNQRFWAPAPANGAQFDSTQSVVFVAPRTPVADGRLTLAYPRSLATPYAEATDQALGAAAATQWCKTAPPPLTTGAEYLFHARATSLVVRTTDLTEVASIKTPDEPALILRGQPYDPLQPQSVGGDVWVFYRNKSFVDYYTWTPYLNELRLVERHDIPRCNTFLAAVYDGTRLCIVSRTRVIVYDPSEGAVVWQHHDPNGRFSGVTRFLASRALSYEDGADDDEYRDAVQRARFNPGKDRMVRDHYVLADHFSQLIHLIGSAGPPHDPVTRGPTQPLIAYVGRRWLVLDPVTGRLVTSGDLVFRFRGHDVAEGLHVAEHIDGGVAVGDVISRETSAGTPMRWAGTPAWREDADKQRFAFFDGSTFADISLRKQVFLTGAFTFTAWVRCPADTPDGFYPIIGGWRFQGVSVFAIKRQGGASSAGWADLVGQFACPDLFDDQWHHVALVRSASGAGAVYVDSVLVGSGVVPTFDAENSSDFPTLGGPMRLGRGGPGIDSLYFRGWLGDVRIYQLEASAGFLADLFAAGPVGGGSPAITDDALLLEDGFFLLLEDDSLLGLE
jgi:hypothetical protein